MYSAKEQGKNKYQFYSAEFTAKAMRQLSIESDLRRALERNEFELYYQPQCSLKDGSIVGMEALIRWNHPERVCRAGCFLGAAEESGLMVALDRWVFAAACRQCREWIDAGITSVRMSVNISGGQINQGHLVEMISDVLKETGVT
ncbi:EAL domain-containing protein [Candidatus Reidiella endopervernicosa]|nr:EAL domain-containing protein [Candidatus Reidiella endopervernicosa]